MKIHIPPSIFPDNRLKEIYYKSFLAKDAEEKFIGNYQGQFPTLVRTNKEILMIDLKWGTGRKPIIRLPDKPGYVVKRSSCSSADILYFKKEILQEKAIIQCHFLKDQFYYAHIDFITTLPEPNCKIIGLLEDKYSIGNPPPPLKMVIQDEAKNKLIIGHNVYLHLDYLRGKPSIEKIITFF